MSENSLIVPSNGMERLAALLSHGSPFLGLPLLMPLLVLVLYPILLPPSPYVRQQSLQALMFHLLIAIGSGILTGIGGAFWYIVLIGWPFAVLFWAGAGIVLLWGLIVEIIACVKALQGEPYQLPIVGK